MKRKESKKVNTYLLTTSTTVVVVIVLNIIKYLRGESIDPIEALISAIIFWIFYFLGFQFFTKLIEKRRK
jgi:predicted Na+-dependent transporter